MKKITGIVLAIVTALTITGWIIWNHTPLIKGIIATNMYGTEKCTDHEGRELEKITTGIKIPGGSSPAFYSYTCELCHKNVMEPCYPNDQYKLCRSCADLTNRCKECGQLRD